MKSDDPEWTDEFHDSTDNGHGGCTYQWRPKCVNELP